MEQTARVKGPYREVLDWLTAQVDRLDEHAQELAREAQADGVSGAEFAARNQAIVDARAWLADQLEQALTARGLSLAA